MEKRLAVQDPLMQSRHHQILLWIVALSLIVSGIFLSRIQFMGTEWLTRAGCVIVILGIWSGLSVIVQEQIILSRLKRQKRNSITCAKARLAEEGVDKETSEKEIEDINQAYEKQADDLTQKLKFSLGVLEMSLLITGTFLWGFGDLFT
jgi:uncharacterized membrane protein YcjF (UPF0283 family)